MRRVLFFTTVFFLLLALVAVIPSVEEDWPSVGLAQSPDSLSEINLLVEKAVADGVIPGGVVLVSHQKETVLLRAYGHRSLEPTIELMTTDTIFDLASLTKVVATAPAIMLLVEKGKLKLGDRAVKYIPAFAGKGKKEITIRQLLTHYSGLPADLKPSRMRRVSGQKLLSRIYQVKPVAQPGVSFIYSDLGFIVLGKIVEKVSGTTLDQFTRKNLYEPLKMFSTGFRPKAETRHLIAPTERTKEGNVLRGQVHDPTAARLGGVAGNAGLFSTAEDLARFCSMTLAKGELDGVRVLRPESIAIMTSPQSPPSKTDVRGLGWDIQSVYSSVKGIYFSPESFGHTGYTGTSMWLDPVTKTSVIVLTNRVHPRDKGDIKLLRSTISSAVGLSLIMPPTTPPEEHHPEEPEPALQHQPPFNIEIR